MLRKTKYSLISAAAGLSLLGGVLGASAAGPNLVTNPGFDSGLAGWSAGATTPWVASAASDGWLKVINNAPWDLKTVGLVGQCVPVEPGTEYRFAAEAAIPQDQEREGGGQLVLIFNSGAACDGSQLTAYETGTVGTSDWSPMQLIRTSPATAHSAWAYLSATKNKPYVGQDWEAPFVANFDNVYFGENATAPAPDQRPEDEQPTLEEPENPTPPDEPQVEGDEPQDRPGDQPQDEPSDEPQDEPGDEPQDEPEDEPQDEPGDQPQDEPGDVPADEHDDVPANFDQPLPPATGDGFAINDPNLTLALGVGLAGAALFAVGAATVPVRRRN